MTIYMASESGICSRCEDRGMADYLLTRLPNLKEVSAGSYWQERTSFRLAGRTHPRRERAQAYSTRLALAARERKAS